MTIYSEFNQNNILHIDCARTSKFVSSLRMSQFKFAQKREILEKNRFYAYVCDDTHTRTDRITQTGKKIPHSLYYDHFARNIGAATKRVRRLSSQSSLHKRVEKSFARPHPQHEASLHTWALEMLVLHLYNHSSSSCMSHALYAYMRCIIMLTTTPALRVNRKGWTVHKQHVLHHIPFSISGCVQQYSMQAVQRVTSGDRAGLNATINLIVD